LALLEKGVQLPGDPTAEVQPLFLNESMSNSLCRIVDGKIQCDVEGKPVKEVVTTTAGTSGKCVCRYCGNEKPRTEAACNLQICGFCGNQFVDEPEGRTLQGFSVPDVDKSPHGSPDKIVEAVDAWHEFFAKQIVEKLELTEAVWDSAYKRGLPDSSYAVIDAGCSKEDGKTAQRCRHLPYKDAQGNVDRVHLAAALAAIKGARTGEVPPYASKAKGKLCSVAAGLGLKSTVCGTAENFEEEIASLRSLQNLAAVKSTARLITRDGVIEGETSMTSEEVGYAGQDPIRPKPWGKTSAPLKDGGHGPEAIQDLQIKNAKLAAENADLSARMTNLATEKNAADHRYLDQIADLQQKLSDAEKRLATIDSMKVQVGEASAKVADRDSKIATLKDTLDTKETKIKTLDEQIKLLNKRIDILENKGKLKDEQTAELKGKIDALMIEVKESRVAAAGAKEQALLETRDRARIQEENAELRGQRAEDTKRIAKLTEKMSKESRNTLVAERDSSKLRAKVQKLEEAIKTKDGLIKEAARDNKRLHKVLKKNQIYEVDEQGNLKM